MSDEVDKEACPTVNAMRIARDHSLHFFLEGGEHIALSRQQLVVLTRAASEPTGGVYIRDLHLAAYETDNPTRSQQAALSRLVRRLRERGLLCSCGPCQVKLTDAGAALVLHAKEVDWPTGRQWQ
jgi:hypothetical protein